MEGLTNSKNTYKTAFQYVLTSVRNYGPIYFHCAIGRDRTGTLAFLIEGLLGMSKSDIYKDYELTNFSYFNTPCSKGQLDDMFAMIEAQEGETLEEKFRTYLMKDFGITGRLLDEFREKMLEAETDDGIECLPQDRKPGEAASQRLGTMIYNLNGQRIDSRIFSDGTPLSPERQQELKQLPKGIYIVNGKKLLVP